VAAPGVGLVGEGELGADLSEVRGISTLFEGKPTSTSRKAKAQKPTDDESTLSNPRNSVLPYIHTIIKTVQLHTCNEPLSPEGILFYFI
jgi:hypothetical protein